MIEELQITKNKKMADKDILLELKKSRSETFKYVNRLLEVEERWTFINILLKKLNVIKNKNELCKTICEGFLKLTNSNAAACFLFNNDSCTIEFKKILFSEDNLNNKKKINELLEKINVSCEKMLKNSTEIKKIKMFFESQNKKTMIMAPIIYSKTFLGYLMLTKNENDFYKENINFINIFPEHIALILENISLYQESEKSNKRKIEFLAGIAHEFKTPLNSIIGFGEIIKTKDKNLQNEKYINNILQSSKHLLSLIEDVLDVSKNQYNSLDLNYSRFNPKNEILKIISTLEKMLAEKNIHINYTLCDIKISADLKRFRQLIYNLVSNAIKFNKQNGTINILTYTQNGNFFFEITDTGDGISKRNHDKIFDFFSQVNRSQLKRQLGSGVGLALCKMITNAHKGEINFKSQIKKGSCFWFNLPIEK